MRALFLDRGRLKLADAPIPDRPGECLVRVAMTGICGTDLELVKGYAGFSGIPGHEFVGIVENVSRPFDLVVETTGAADGLARALGLVRPRGTVVLKSTVHDSGAIDTWPIVVDEITVVGPRCGPFLAALNLLARGTVKVAPPVTFVTGLDDFARAFREAAFREAATGLKAVFAVS